MGRDTLAQKIRKDIICGDDGYYFYYPNKPGGFTSDVLREVVRILDEMNAEWHKIVLDNFK